MDVSLKGVSGIYRISNVKDARCYIGSAVSLYGRYHVHWSELRNGNHHSSYLQRFVNKYGLDALRFEVVEECRPEDLLSREQYWIDSLRPAFNSVPLAGNTLGYKHTPETLAKMSEARKGQQRSLGRKLSDETKQKISAKQKARGLHPNFKAASVRANTGRKQTPEEIEKRSLAQSKVSRQEAREIWCASQLGVYQNDIARAYGISQRLVVRVLHGIGIYGQYRELDADYFQAQEERFARHTAQERLFVPETKVEQLSLAV